jgi:23S rRNA U2552 (ribose-2'-O)-methylase RlmE/FtsJ
MQTHPLYHYPLQVTADGSISCADEPDKQEIVIGQLFYCEVVAALVNLACGGSLVVKMFTMFEHHTVSILYLLCSLFEEVEMIKPGSIYMRSLWLYCMRFSACVLCEQAITCEKNASNLIL